MWVDGINARGGLLGRPVELILYDDQSDTNRVGTHYKTLIDRDHVDLLLSPYGSPATIAASEVSEQYKYVMIACAASSEKVYSRGYQYLFGIYAPADRFCIGFLDVLARRGMTRAAIVYEQSAFHESIYTGFLRWAAIFGVDVVYSQGFPAAASRFETIVDKLKIGNPDALVLTSYPPQGYDFIRVMQKADYRPPAFFMTITPVHPDFYVKAGRFAEGVFGPSHWEPIESIPFQGTKQFVHDFKQRTGHLPSYHATAAYSACLLLERAVKETKSLDHDKLREVIFRLDTVSILGRFKVDETGQQVGHNPMLIQWQQGKKEIVYPAKMKTAEPLLNGSR
jgi:branched-chain amino acid transport system substrate-binding protein